MRGQSIEYVGVWVSLRAEDREKVPGTVDPIFMFEEKLKETLANIL